MSAGRDEEPVYACLFDAAVHFRPTAVEWASALAAVPEPRERAKLQQYRPPTGVRLHEHYNPRSSVAARHLLRAMLTSSSTSTPPRAEVGEAPSSTTASAAAPPAALTAAQTASSPSSCPCTHAPRCSCCGRHIVPLLRTFEGRPCVAGPLCTCAATSSQPSGADAATAPPPPQHQSPPPRNSVDGARPCDHPLVEDLPSVNLSHNNGVVFAALSPTMAAHDGGGGGGGGTVVGADVMCIDLVPSAIDGSLVKCFTADAVDELMGLLHPYMTPKEWAWINAGAARRSAAPCSPQRSVDFAAEYFSAYERRRRFCGGAADGGGGAAACVGVDSAPQSASARAWASNARVVVALYRLWRFLVLWAIKEAVLKAAGIGLGFDTQCIEICVDGTAADADVDSPEFYSAVLSLPVAMTTTTGVPAIRPCRHLNVTVSVPSDSGVEPGGVFGNSFFDTWLLWDRGSMSVAAVVCAPAYISRWSGHSTYALKRRAVVSSADGADEEDAAAAAMEQRERHWIRAHREATEVGRGGVSGASASSRQRVLRLRQWKIEACSDRAGRPECHGFTTVTGLSLASRGNGPCCGCCLSMCLQ